MAGEYRNQTEKKELSKKEDILAREERILAKEEAILKEEEALEKRIGRNAWLSNLTIGVLIIIAVAAFTYWRVTANEVYIEKSQVTAPLIELGSPVAGKIEAVYVKEGDEVPADTIVARVGDALVKTKVAGEIVQVKDTVGELASGGEPVVTMINPDDLRVVGQIDEDKGLSQIRVGDKAVFTVDAFGGKEYSGFVDEISPTSNETSVVFNISDKRQIQQFDVKVRFDHALYPELKNGMSAKIWVSTN